MIPPGHKSLTCGLDPQDFYPGGLEEYTHTHACTHASMHARSVYINCNQAGTGCQHAIPSSVTLVPFSATLVFPVGPIRAPAADAKSMNRRYRKRAHHTCYT